MAWFVLFAVYMYCVLFYAYAMPNGTPPLSADAKKIIHSVHLKAKEEALEARSSVLIEASGYNRAVKLCGVAYKTVNSVEAE